MVAAFAVGVYLRLDQFGAQVLIDDEWHVVHQVMLRTPGEMLLDFGYADYGIPLGLLAWIEARAFGLSETLLRAPMLACGIATLAVFTVYVARRFPPVTAAIFAWLIAMSPLLIIYSRMARPYAITLILGYVAHAAFLRYWNRSLDRARSATAPADGSTRAGAGATYAFSAALATWMHPIAGPFVLAPLAWGALDAVRADAPRRRAAVVRLLALALPTGAALAALVLPPLLANPVSLSLKSGVDSPTLDAVVGALHAWLGTPSTAVVALCIVLAAIGARDVARALPEARTAALGVALTFAAILVTRPAWSSNAVSVARYLLPIVPLLLLAVAAGAAAIVRRIGAASLPRRAAAAVAAVAPCAALAVASPLADMLRTPNSETLHLVYHFDLRPDRNPYLPYVERIPLSPFWASLGEAPRGRLRIAAAPFYYESYNWDAPRWERLSGQTVVPGWLTGLCVVVRGGEVPRDARFRFANAVHLADASAMAERRIDYVVWQKPFEQVVRGARDTVGVATAHCEPVLRERFGPPVYEDDALIAFRLGQAAGDANAAR